MSSVISGFDDEIAAHGANLGESEASLEWARDEEAAESSVDVMTEGKKRLDTHDGLFTSLRFCMTILVFLSKNKSGHRLLLVIY